MIGCNDNNKIVGNRASTNIPQQLSEVIIKLFYVFGIYGSSIQEREIFYKIKKGVTKIERRICRERPRPPFMDLIGVDEEEKGRLLIISLNKCQCASEWFINHIKMLCKGFPRKFVNSKLCEAPIVPSWAYQRPSRKSSSVISKLLELLGEHRKIATDAGAVNKLDSMLRLGQTRKHRNMAWQSPGRTRMRIREDKSIILGPLIRLGHMFGREMVAAQGVNRYEDDIGAGRIPAR